MLKWLEDNQEFVWVMTGVSAGLFLLTLIALPILVARIPEDYFVPRHRKRGSWDHMSAAAKFALLIGKNVLGVIVLLAGVAMLVLPGQGLLAILVGVLLIDFPGKYRFERWLVRKRVVLRPLNWIRSKAGKPPLRVA